MVVSPVINAALCFSMCMSSLLYWNDHSVLDKKIYGSRAASVTSTTSAVLEVRQASAEDTTQEIRSSAACRRPASIPRLFISGLTLSPSARTISKRFTPKKSLRTLRRYVS